MDGVFKFSLGALVMVPLTNQTGTIIDRTAYDEAEPSYLIAWDDETGSHEDSWSENSIELAEGAPS